MSSPPCACWLLGAAESLHSRAEELVVSEGDGAGEGDGACEVFEDDGLEPEPGGGDGGEAHAEVVGEAGEEEALKVALPEVAGETGGGDAVVFGEGRVAVDVASEALTKDELGVRDADVTVEIGAGCSLDGVIGPEVLGAIGGFDGVGEGVLLVRRCERDVAGGVPVLSEDDVVELCSESVDTGDDLVATTDGKGAAGHEVVLHVDDEEGVGGLEVEHAVSLV